MKEIPFYHVDSFTDRAFSGNPAGVCFFEDFPDDETMRKIAAEINLSETAFAVPYSENKSGKYKLRWFTPRVEVPLCGHATLATAAVLFKEIKVETNEIVFDTLSGLLGVRKSGDSYIMNFPADEIRHFLPPIGFLESLGNLNVVNAVIGKNTKKVLIEVESAHELIEISPDFSTLLESVSLSTVRGLIVTATGYDDYDFISRYFAPWVGINEDPVTGSAHTLLGPYWKEKTGNDLFKAYQASPRGGELEVRVTDDRVELLANAVIILSGRFYLG